MPRSGGSYSLPSPPHPLVANTLAKAEDLNTVHTDIASALTGSVPVDGSAAMTGALTLSTSTPTAALQAASKGYVDAQISNLLTGDMIQSGTLQATNFVATNTDVVNLIAQYTKLGTSGTANDGTVGFYGTTPAARGTVTGSRGGNAALASLLAVLASYGLIVDSSSA